MKMIEVAAGVSATGVANQTGVATDTTPFLAGRDVVLEIQSNGMTGTPTVLVQTSPDNSTWTTVATHTALYSKKYNIKCSNYIRLGVTVVGSAGTVSAYITNGV